jgi:serine/threonine protein kinase
MLRKSLERRDILVAGALIGERYRIVAPLARGGFGAVYVAEQLTTERRVALKVLWPFHDDMPVNRILAEARVASGIRSDHIVQVIDGGIDLGSGAVFVVMELLVGRTLAGLVEERGALPAAEVAEYIRQIAAGLDKVHGHVNREGQASPIVHRDLKPANVFVTERDDGSALVKLLDFGTAKVLSRMTHHSREVRGTPQYMAYEQASGDTVSPATDIWALGLIAFFLLTASSYWRSASEDGSDAQLFAELLTLPLAPPTERVRQLGLRVQLPRAFDAWFQRTVVRDPKARFATAGLAAQELTQALGVTPGPVPGPGRMADKALPRELETQDHAAVSHTPWHARPARRSRVALFAGVSIAGALLGALSFFVLRNDGLSRSPPEPADAGSHAASAAALASAPSASLPASSATAAVAPTSPIASALPSVRPVASSDGRPPRLVTTTTAKARATVARGAASASPIPAPRPKRDVYEMR